MAADEERGPAADRTSLSSSTGKRSSKSKRTPLGLPERVAKAARGATVIPQNLDKHPRFPWREFQERRPTDAELNQWAMDYPHCLWAMLTGQPSGVVVFDFDGKEGLATMKRLNLVPTVTTQSGGAHVYVYAPEWPVKGGARIDPEAFPGMDLRADGQLATFYGKNPFTGGTYERTGNKWYRFDDLPVELQRLLTDRRKETNRQAVPLPDGFSDFAAQDALLREATELIESGSSRNGAGFHLACQLRDERNAFDEAWTVMQRFAEQVRKAGPHPYTMQEAYNSLASAYSSEAREPRALGKLKLADGYPTTDLGNAERLIARHGVDLRFCKVWNKWLVWDGRRWAKDSTGGMERKAKDTARQIARSAADLDSDDHRLRLIKWSAASESAAKLKAMAAVAESEAEVAITPQDVDKDQWLLTCENGTLDLRDGSLHKHDRSDLITRLAPVRYDPHASCPLFESFLTQVLPDPELRGFVQRAVGYSLTGSTKEQVAFMLYGTGSNGKSTFLEVIRSMFGDYAQQAPSDLLLSKQNSGIPNDVARLQGARLITTVETEEGRRLAEALFKSLTGGDRVTARFLHGEFFEFDMAGKFWLGTNHKPEVKSSGEAVWRRIHLIPFTVTIAGPKKDGSLKERTFLTPNGRRFLRSAPSRRNATCGRPRPASTTPGARAPWMTFGFRRTLLAWSATSAATGGSSWTDSRTT